MTDYTNYEMGVDLSVYEPRVDYQLLKDNGVKFIIARAGKGNYYNDPTFAIHCQGAYDVDLPFGFYWVHDPMVDINRIENDELQLNAIKKAVAGKKFSFAVIDVEIFYYYNEKNEKIIIPDNNISETARVLAAKMRNYFKIPVVIYTRHTFVYEHAHQMEIWLSNLGYDLWLAYYPFSTSLVYTTWDKVKGMIPSTINSKYLYVGTVPAWTMWQINDKFVLPGILDQNNKPTAVDVNLFNIAKGTVNEWCGYVPRNQEPPTPPVPPDPPADPPVQSDPKIEARLTDAETRLTAVESDVESLKAVIKAAGRLLSE